MQGSFSRTSRISSRINFSRSSDTGRPNRSDRPAGRFSYSLTAVSYRESCRVENFAYELSVYGSRPVGPTGRKGFEKLRCFLNRSTRAVPVAFSKVETLLDQPDRSDEVANVLPKKRPVGSVNRPVGPIGDIWASLHAVHDLKAFSNYKFAIYAGSYKRKR